MDDRLPSVLTVKEVAAALRISPSTVKKMLLERRLKGFKAGGQWRIPHDEVRKVLST